ncbi:MAG: flagellar basal body rod protein FlgB [Sporomusaceae bacterium]|nr:flagellar basal body rod protein FlgB [Sporomusaceae bacterium]
MLDSMLSASSAGLLEKALSASALRQKVISNNIVNVNTPGFKRSEVIFEDKLQQAIGGPKLLSLVRTHGAHLSGTREVSTDPAVVVDKDTSMRLDGNNVDIDKEMAGLAKNSIYYNSVAQQLSKKYSTLVSAIKEGK